MSNVVHIFGGKIPTENAVSREQAKLHRMIRNFARAFDADQNDPDIIAAARRAVKL